MDVAEPISEKRVEEIFNLADEIIRAPSRFTKDFVVQELGRGVAELAGATERARAELEQLRAEARPEWRIEFDVWHGTDGPTFSREPSARNWLHSYRDNNPGKNDARLQQRYRSDWANVEQQPENSKTSCAFPDCGHPDHQREQQPEDGDRG